MSSKIIFFILVVVLAVSGVWIYTSLNSAKKILPVNPAVDTVANPSGQSGQNINSDKLTSSVNDTSNSALSSDLSVIDNQIQNLNNAVNDADQSVIVSVSATSAVSTKTAKKFPTESISTIINRADNEINQKIDSLNNLVLQINSLENISVSLSDNLTSSVQNEINQLSTLQEKIDFDTSLPTAQVDYKAITDSYGAYDLLSLRVDIIIASDKTLTVTGSMNIVENKVRSRISGLTGINASTINQIFSDFRTKSSDAKFKANIAIGLISTPTSNTLALKNALLDIKTASDDLIAARKDIGTVIKDLAEMGNVAAPDGSATQK